MNTIKIKPFAFDLAPLVEAINEYDRTAPDREKLWDNVDSNEDVFAAEKADQEALVKVQKAFWEVTQDRNSLESCGRISIDFARKIAALGQEG